MAEYYGTGMSVEKSKEWLESHGEAGWASMLDEGMGCAVFVFAPNWDSNAYNNQLTRDKLAALAKAMYADSKKGELK